MLHQISDEERTQLKHVIDQRYSQLHQDESEYGNETSNLEVTQTDAYLISYEDRSLLVPDTNADRDALESFILEYKETEDFEETWGLYSEILDYEREQLEALVASDQTDNLDELSNVARELSSRS